MDDEARSYVLGLGCERGTPAEELKALAHQAMRMAEISARALAAVASIDNRAQVPAMLAVAAELGVPLLVFDAARLERETPRLKNPSDIVFARVGCHGVAESAAFAVSGDIAELVVPKIKSVRATAAIARSLLQKA